MTRLLAGIMLLGCVLPAQQAPAVRRRVNAPTAFYDDAEIVTPGWMNAGMYYSYTKVPAGRDLSFPSVYVAVGLNKRVGISGSTSYARSQFEEVQINARGDSFLAAKFLVVPEGERRPAVAVEPMIEVLGDASIGNSPLSPERVNYVFPLILQKSFDSFRTYYTAGYLTRGIIFNSIVFEVNKWSRVTPIVIVAGSRLTSELAFISELGLNRSRSDAIAGAVVAIRPGLAVFANTGRSFGREDLNSSRYRATVGLSFNARLWGDN